MSLTDNNTKGITNNMMMSMQNKTMLVRDPHLLVNFVEHCWVVVFFGVVVEAYHTILLVNASVDLTIFNLQNTKKNMKNMTFLLTGNMQLILGLLQPIVLPT